MRRQLLATYFTGLRNSGKTTIGRQFAEKHSLPFYDIDEEIEKNMNRPISKVYAKYGAEALNLCQYIMVLQVLEDIEVPGTVISMGGGVADNKHVMNLIYRTGNVIYLRAPFELLYKRLLEEKELPQFIDKNNPERSFRIIYNRRSKIYEKYANRIIDVDKEIEL